MQTQIKKLENLIWINIVKPELAEVKKILSENGMNESLADEIINPSLKSKIDTLRNALYLTLHFPIKREEVIGGEEVDFLVKNNLIITSQYKEIKIINEYVDKLELNPSAHGGIYFANFLKSLYQNIENSIEALDTDIKNIEKEIFINDERRIIEDITLSSRKVFNFKTALAFHPEVLLSFKENSVRIFGFEFQNYADSVYEFSKKLNHEIANQKQFIDDLKDTTDFLLTNKTNKLVKTFTVISFIILPMSFLASFFGMNTRFPNDLVSSPFGTVYIMFLMLFTSLLILMYLHFKKYI